MEEVSEKKSMEADYEKLFRKLDSSKEGLSSQAAKERIERYGYNRIEEKRKSLMRQILGYFMGPIPWMIEVAAILSLIVRHWSDFFIILSLLLVNGLVDFWEEFQAGNAIAALKKSLALKALVKRDGRWQEIDASLLVPGDVIQMRLGNVIPADVTLLSGEYLSVDQAALTGESLPVTKRAMDTAFSGSIVKQGEMEGVVHATGAETFFGKTTKLVEQAHSVSHFQKAVLQIGDYLIYLSLGLALILMVAQLLRADPWLELIQFILILVIASIPVAMPAVLSVTMALGALRLSKMQAIVTKLESIEEIAGIDVLCCDKTGTLTQNKLTMGEPKAFGSHEVAQLLQCAAGASKWEGQDPIDLAILQAAQSHGNIQEYRQEKFVPFDPVRKRADALLVTPQGEKLYVTKGAPQIVLALCNPAEEMRTQVFESITEYAKKGHRALGVAFSHDGKAWEFLGLLPLFDPLREDSIEVIAQAQEQGLHIKMLTGDNIAIAKEIAHQLQIGDSIAVLEEGKELNSQEMIDKIEESTGFAQIFPEHKCAIVKALQDHKHIVGMTGDGVNDAPALKQADVGIAVSGATDAARAAGSLVLLRSGLSVIIKAIEEARRIFERMNSYAIYRITETIRIMLFMAISILVFNFYPITAVMIILLALLNDLPILTIAYDNTLLSKTPVKWEMRRVLTLATILGCVGIIETFLLLFLVKDVFRIDFPVIQSMIFLKLSVAGHQTLFITRAKGPFFKKPYPAFALWGAIVATQTVAAVFVGLGIFVTAVPWSYIGLIWAYTLVWMFIEDGIKLAVYRYLDFTGAHHKRFLSMVKRSLFSHSLKR